MKRFLDRFRGGNKNQGRFETVIDDKFVRISIVRGNSRRVIISFAGIGMGFGGPVEEFAQSLALIDSECTKVFVIDKTRSWYERNFKQTLSTLHPIAASAGEVVLVGASMGGFGALLFAPILPNVKLAACFTPQFSIAPAVVQGIDRRYSKYARSINDFAFGHPYIFGRCDASRFVVFGGDTVDAWHLEQHRKFLTPHDAVIEFPGAGHNVSAYLKQHQVLIPLLQAIVDRADIAQAISMAPGGGIEAHFSTAPATAMGTPDTY